MAMQYASTVTAGPSFDPNYHTWLKPWMRGYVAPQPTSAGPQGGVGAVGAGGAGVISPNSPVGWTPAYGGVPTVPDPAATAAAAIGANASNFGDSSKLAAAVNTFNQSQLLGQYEAAIPNYSDLVSQRSNIINQQMSGNVPTDVLNQIISGAAERGILTGTTGSQSANAAYLRALGLTSIGQQQSGQQNFSTAISQAPIVNQFDPSSMFVSPDAMQSARMAANVYAAAPIPSAAAQAALQTYNNAFNAGSRTQMPSVGSGYNPAPYQPLPAATPVVAPRFAPAQAFTPSTQPASTAAHGWNLPYNTNPWANINPEDYRYAEGSSPADTGGMAYDYASMFADAGQPYVDYNAGEWANYDWSQYE